ncbi:helix-turn-helix domain-containing protein [Collinsella tanakaei]|nr:helix-turn-helix domain-containing protein [Collinsella tanakaei]
MDAFQTVFEAYTRHNGSIVHCADELYLHKNTLQNRLNKMAAKTGYNPRTLADHTVLAMAFLMRDYRRHTADAQ